MALIYRKEKFTGHITALFTDYTLKIHWNTLEYTGMVTGMSLGYHWKHSRESNYVRFMRYTHEIIMSSLLKFSRGYCRRLCGG